MNKLRLIKISELRGKIHPIEQFIIEMLDGIEMKIYPKYILYMKDSKTYFSYYHKDNDIYLYNTCYKNLDKFGDIEEIREIMKYLLEKHLKIEIKEVN